MPQMEVGDKAPLQIGVSARQFEWRMRYPSPERWKAWRNPANKNDEKVRNDLLSFGRVPQMDDVRTVNELHCFADPKATDVDRFEDFPAVVVHLDTIDIIHSFNIPYMRVKQDSLPGKIIPVWFRPTKSNTKKVKDEKTDKWVWLDGYPLDGDGKRDRSQIWEIPCAELCGRDHSRMIGRVYVHETEADFLDWLQTAWDQQYKQTGPEQRLVGR
jgi:cytochrome c oxidase subunit 2